MLEEITRVSRELEAADPKWMRTASGEYGTMKNSIKELKNYVQNENHLLVNGTNDKEFDRILWNSVTQQDGNRKEDPGNQKLEKRRVHNRPVAYFPIIQACCLNVYFSVHRLCCRLLSM